MPTVNIDIDHDNFDDFIATAVRCGMTVSAQDMDGPGGGNPSLDITASSRDGLKDFLLKHYDPSMDDDDFDLYLIEDEGAVPSP